MEQLHAHLIAHTQGAALSENTVTVGNTRISVLLDRVIRVEFDKAKSFTDMPTQSIWFRDHGKVEFTAKQSGNRAVITTDKAEFTVNTQNGKVLTVNIDGKTVRPSNKHNLKGTARTLDGTFGAIPLKDGVISSDGVALFDDSKSLLLGEDGMVHPRKTAEQDLYVFAFGTDYIGAVKALYALSGEVPLVPRFALGNWWSRYYPYKQAEYENLMLEFARKEIPLTVATVDMDWHWVRLEEHFDGKFGKNHWGGVSGWTGYSWNTDLFPDPQGFLQFLHKQGLKTTLNLHPADGFRWFEDCYSEMADAMGAEKDKKETVEFDIADAKFINSYMDIGHHKHETDGVDFWWIDWQQGKKSKLAGLDPLWSLNHYHYFDNGRDT
ncbi:MAG: TIM-barrel domain-containing protein, partial [Candidatus Fimenecus sp.]